MLKRNAVKLVGGLLLGGIALLPLLSGCGGSAKPSTSAAVAAPASTTAPATPAPATPAPATPAPANDRLAEGKVVFMERAGGTGCQACHGVEGKGNTEVGAPEILGKSEADVRKAMDTVEMMRIVKLTDEEITAVVEYLQFINK